MSDLINPSTMIANRQHDAFERVARCLPAALAGSVVRLEGLVVGVADFPAPVGAQVAIETAAARELAGEVVGFRDDLALVYPWGAVDGVRYGQRVRLQRTTRVVPVGDALLGRVIDARGRPIDGQGPAACPYQAPLDRAPPAAILRPRIDRPFKTGIRAIDGLLTCGLGQRLGIFAGAGVGKSVSLGMLVRNAAADVVVVAMIGERGREVNEFLQRDLGEDGRARSVVVVATSDEPAPLRVRAAFTATAIAEHFRDQGRDVLLLMDSLTRFAHAHREIGLGAGEPPATRGYPPSTFALLPRLLERSGRAETGSITGFYSVLVDGDDQQEPVSDTVRGLLDGHVWLSRKLASQGHFPAIDVLESVSRVMPDVVSRDHRLQAVRIREWLAAYQEHADLIALGAYKAGANPVVDMALERRAEILRFLRQDLTESAPYDAMLDQLNRVTSVSGPRSMNSATAAMRKDC
ncbi:MAG: Flagellum-specific synthase [Planctomycetota bacterium]|jgi:flagellum-specific ATP synthase